MKTKFLIIILFGFYLKSYAQFNDTITNVHEDKELIAWTEDYLMKTGYIKKDKKGYQVALSSTYYKDLFGLYSLHIIEKQEFDTSSVTLYRLHVGSDHDHPMIVKREMKLSRNVSRFTVFGESSNLESVYQLYLFFNKASRFTIGTQKYCYDMLLQNYDDYINPH